MRRPSPSLILLLCIGAATWTPRAQSQEDDEAAPATQAEIQAQAEALREEARKVQAREITALNEREDWVADVASVLSRLDDDFVATGQLSDSTVQAVLAEDAAGALGFENFALDPETDTTEAGEEVAAAFAAIREGLGGAPTRPGEIKIKEARPSRWAEEDTLDVKVRVRYVREEAVGGAVSLVNVFWRLRTTRTDEGALILGMATSAPDSHHSAAPSNGVPMEGRFTDVTGSVFTGARAALLRPSIPGLRNLLDSGLGVGVLGHHGVVVADLNSDGIDDLYLCQPGGIPNQLWLRQPDGTAVEVAPGVGLDFVDATTSALFVDLDGDGDRDGVFGVEEGVRVYVRRGDVYTEALRFDRGAITSLAAADADGDGRIDLYACAYANPYNGTAFPVPYHDAKNGQDNLFLVNRTNVKDELVLLDATQGSGLSVGASRFSFAATFEDFDDDGDADLYVANDFGRNALYVNTGSGLFVERAADFGVVDIAAGMGAAFADWSGDGIADLYVANMESSAGRRITGQEAFQPRSSGEERDVLKRHAKGNTLFFGQKGGPFVEQAAAAAGQWAWGAIPIDLNGDGALDIYVPNGFVTGSTKNAPDL